MSSQDYWLLDLFVWGEEGGGYICIVVSLIGWLCKSPQGPPNDIIPLKRASLLRHDNWRVFCRACSTGTVTQEDGQEAAWAVSLCHRLRQTQTPGGSFPLTKKAALLGRLLQTREALQLLRSPVRHPGTQTIAEQPCVWRAANALQPCRLDYYSPIPSAVHRTRLCA